MLAVWAILVASSMGPQDPRIAVTLVRDEADAALSILEKRLRHEPVEDSDWRTLFQSEGYRRLKQREESFKRSFTEADFRTFLLSEATVSQTKALRQTLEAWSKLDLTGPAQKALAYLPVSAKIRVKVYPSIKPQSNTFVFDVKSDPAIFFYLETGLSPQVFENTLAHEFHHIGYGASCPDPAVRAQIDKLPDRVKRAQDWIGAFGEGMAMLAAAGGPERHPHEFSAKADRERWDKDMANFDLDLKSVEDFLSEVLAGKLSEEEENKRGYGFFGIQGPWYTVGWKMAAWIERAFGRAALIDCMRDPRRLLQTFNRAVEATDSKPKPAQWSARFLAKLKPPSTP